jgi:hypothetical protein
MAEKTLLIRAGDAARDLMSRPLLAAMGRYCRGKVEAEANNHLFVFRKPPG